MKKYSEEERQLFRVIGERLAFYRKRRKLTQEELALRVRVSKTFLSKLESPNSEKGLSLLLLVDLAEALNVPIGCFFRSEHGQKIKY